TVDLGVLRLRRPRGLFDVPGVVHVGRTRGTGSLGAPLSMKVPALSMKIHCDEDRHSKPFLALQRHIRGAGVSASQWNWSASVEPFSAVVADVGATAVLTRSK